MRTEQKILKDFEALGYKIKVNNASMIYLTNDYAVIIHINKLMKWYAKCTNNNNNEIVRNFTMQEHKLLNELFTLWGWL